MKPKKRREKLKRKQENYDRWAEDEPDKTKVRATKRPGSVKK